MLDLLAASAVVEAVKAPARRARAAQLQIVALSAMGSAITTDEIAAKVPKDAISVYVKVEENKIYWVGKRGDLVIDASSAAAML